MRKDRMSYNSEAIDGGFPIVRKRILDMNKLPPVERELRLSLAALGYGIASTNLDTRLMDSQDIKRALDVCKKRLGVRSKSK
jgi:hypothetical protein